MGDVRARRDDRGFGLVELVIAMFLLALITIALVPALYNGIVYSSQQSTTATATRQLNSLIELARQTHECGTAGAPVGSITDVTANKSFTDGAGQKFTTSGSFNCAAIPATVQISAFDVNNKKIATVSALVYLQ